MLLGTIGIANLAMSINYDKRALKAHHLRYRFCEGRLQKSILYEFSYFCPSQFSHFRLVVRLTCGNKAKMNEMNEYYSANVKKFLN